MSKIARQRGQSLTGGWGTVAICWSSSSSPTKKGFFCGHLFFSLVPDCSLLDPFVARLRLTGLPFSGSLM